MSRVITRRRGAIGVCVVMAVAGPSTSRSAPPQTRPVSSPAAVQGPAPAAAPDEIAALLTRLEAALAGHHRVAFRALLAASADRNAEEESITGYFLTFPFTSAILHERDRSPLAGTLPGDGYRLIADLFASDTRRAKVERWQMDVRRGAEGTWGIVRHEILSTIDGLHHLSLESGKAYAARDLTFESEDLTLRLLRGHVFVAEADGVPTGLVLLGEGEMTFAPRPATERGQLKIFCGSDVLRTRFKSAYVRINPGVLIPADQLVPEPPDPSLFERAEELFQQHVTESFVLDLGDLSPQVWSLAPQPGDFLAEVHTSGQGVLTYTRSQSEPEDVSLFERRRKRNIAIYPSAARLASRGASYSDDDQIDYGATRYDLDVAFDPEREIVEGQARLTLTIRSFVAANLTLRLADALAVQSVTSDELGRLLFLRVRNQNSVLVSLPKPQPRGTRLSIRIAYRGALKPQSIEREMLQVQGRQQPQVEEPILIQPEPSFVYSNRSYWYPQSPVGDYATASMRLSVPDGYTIAGSGNPVEPQAGVLAGGRRTFAFVTAEPVRYLSCAISRFVRVDRAPLSSRTPTNRPQTTPGAEEPRGPAAAADGDPPPLTVWANPRQVGHGREMTERVPQIAAFYASLLGGYPYSHLSLALVESNLPGGHSPAYLVVLNQPLPTTPFVWRNDPTNFSEVPSFFLAHEIAHQWWGHAVGWKNYHEQWLSEAFAQYFAALYASQDRGERTFDDVLRRMRRWALDESDQGPISLGYRLGHIQGDSKIFRAIVYDKGAWVLHMLRGLLGDDLFFRSLRRFYQQWRFQKAGTEEFRKVVEAESGADFRNFFDRWVYGTAVPRLEYSYRLAAGSPQEVTVTLRQVGDLFSYPVEIAVTGDSGEPARTLVKMRDRLQTVTIPFSGRLKRVTINENQTALCEVKKGG